MDFACFAESYAYVMPMFNSSCHFVRLVLWIAAILYTLKLVLTIECFIAFKCVFNELFLMNIEVALQGWIRLFIDIACYGFYMLGGELYICDAYV